MTNTQKIGGIMELAKGLTYMEMDDVITLIEGLQDEKFHGSQVSTLSTDEQATESVV